VKNNRFRNAKICKIIPPNNISSKVVVIMQRVTWPVKCEHTEMTRCGGRSVAALTAHERCFSTGRFAPRILSPGSITSGVLLDGRGTTSTSSSQRTTNSRKLISILSGEKVLARATIQPKNLCLLRPTSRSKVPAQRARAPTGRRTPSALCTSGLRVATPLLVQYAEHKLSG